MFVQVSPSEAVGIIFQVPNFLELYLTLKWFSGLPHSVDKSTLNS